MKKVGILYDNISGNTGDVAIGLSVKKILRGMEVDFDELIPGNFNPNDYETIIIGGGHLLRPSPDLFYDKFKIPGNHILNAVGIVDFPKDLHYLEDYRYISVRSSGDREKLSYIKKDVKVIPCTSMLLEDLKDFPLKPKKPSIGIHLLPNFFNEDDEKRFIEWASTLPFTIYFIPITLYIHDFTYFRKLNSKIKNSILLPILKPLEIFTFIGRLDYFISCSLHGAIFSYVHNVPFLLVNGEKMRYFMEDRGIQQYLFTNFHELKCLFEHISRDPPDYSKKISKDKKILHEYIENLEEILPKNKSSGSMSNKKDNQTNFQIHYLQLQVINLEKSLQECEQECEDAIHEKNVQIANNPELNSIKSSVTWRTVMKLHSFVEKLMPPMTRRRGWYDLGIIGLRTIANEGWRSFWRKYRQRRRKVKQESTHHGENFFQKKDKNLDLEKIIEDYVHYTSPRKFRVLYITGAPDLPSNRYRVYNFEEYLSDFEIETNHINQFEISDKLDEILTFDLIVMFRVAMDENLTRLIDICRKLNIPTIFDVDDYVFEPKIATVEYIDGIRFLPKEELSLYFEGVKRYRKTLLSCDYFTTTTEYLAERSKELGKKAFVLRNGLNKEIVEISKRVKESYKKEDNFIKIGYFSGTKTHQKDFAVVVGGIRRILSEYNNVKLLIGGYLDLKEFPELDKFKDRIETLPWVPWQKLPFNIIKADINIVPLEVGNPFSEAKSELKYFEAALLKIPTIASPTDAFKYAIKDGVNGFLAKDENEWYTKLKNLIENEELRRKIGERAYEHSLGEYSAPSLSKVLLDTYKKILVDYKRSKGISADSLSIGIILPPPFSGSGGHMRVFEIGKILSDMGHKVKVYITDSQDFMNSREIEKFIRRNFIDPNFKVVLGVDKITSCDVLIATHWSTAYIVHRYRGRAAKTFHFVQDYEPYFYSMSEDYINADLSYGLADVIITYGKWCYELLKRKNKISSKQKIYRIPFYVNKTIFQPIDNVERKRNRVLFFARPDMPRRLYGLGIKVLKIVASKKPDVEIIFYGSKNINSSKIPFKHKNLGYLRTQHNLVKLYNSATVGLIFTTTNPSMTSFEMMACQCPVVDIKYNNNELNYGDVNNAMLVEPTPECVAEGIIKLLEDDELRNRIAENGYKYVASFPDMEDSLSKFIHILKKEIDDENEVA